MKRLLIVLFVVAVLLGVAILALRSADAPATQASGSIPLPDGSWVHIEAVTYGTNHLVGPALSKVTQRMPQRLRPLMYRIFGKSAVMRFSKTTTSPQLVLWLNRGVSATRFPSDRGYLTCMLSGTNGFTSGEAVHYGAYYPLEAKEVAVFPRREREIMLNIYHHNAQGEVSYSGNIIFPNPEFRSYPAWKPEPLPATRRAGDVEVTFHKLTTDIGNSTTHKSLPGGRTVIEFESRRRGGRNETVCQVDIRSLTNTNEIWRVAGVEVSDATGNRIKNTSLGWGSHEHGYFTFAPGLWANETAWKLSCEIKRAEGFLPEEQFAFRDVPLGGLNATNRVGWTTNFQGVTVTLEHIYRRPPHTNENSWSSENLSRVHFTTSGLTNGLHLDLLSARTGTGTNLTSGSTSTSGSERTYEFRNIPIEASTADFTFAVQHGRRVEFLVKPEVGEARLEYPGQSAGSTELGVEY